MDPYYYHQMNKTQQAAYHAIRTGLLSLAPAFQVPKLENKELGDIFFRLRLDCPEIFYGVGFRYRYFQDSGNVELIPEYLFDKGKIKEHQSALAARVAKLSRPARDLPELEKALYIHDFICSNIFYDKLKKPYSHEIIGPLGHGVGVCEGIAKSVKILCDALGIWCIIAVSEANPEKGIKYRHAWNVIRLGKEYYHLDVTFDNSLSTEDNIRYDYFGLTDKQIFRDHEPVIYQLPQCNDKNGSYYLMKKKVFTKTEDIYKRALQAIRKKELLNFQWRGGYLTQEVLKDILTLLEQAAKEKGKHARASLNWSQAVFSVEFIEEHPVEELVMQEANEGEK